jgi:glyoxylase-like metal-dependent hydrolase (beta-lactamase superfamily II)
VSIPFVTLADPQYGVPVQVSPLIRRVVAKNPSKFTYLGTGTYIVGHGDVAVVDPGPLSPSHQQALTDALGGERVVAILVTHCHSDHSPLSAWLRELTGAPTIASGPHVLNIEWIDDDDAPEEPHPDDIAQAAESDVQVEEALDLDFEPDLRVADGEVAASGDGWTIRAVHTPGHTSNHMAYALEEERALFTGDHIMGWSTTVITPPDGDMRAYFASLDKVRDRHDEVFWPTHGAPVTDTQPFIDAFIEHRRQREAGVLESVRAGVTMIPDIVRRLYVGTPERLYRAAGRSVLAHLIKLHEDGLVVYAGPRPGVKVAYHPA